MKKDVFADWLREFCMLVFIQTVQAFLFAIVMSLILSILGGSFAESDSEVAATSLIAVFLLASVSKIEDIIKKVFGIKSGYHDSGMRGGLKSLATTMMAAGLAKGVTDNIRKFAGGTAGAIRNSRDIARYKTRMARDINQYATPKAGASAAATGNRLATAVPDQGENKGDLSVDDYMKKAVEAKNNGDMRGYERNRGIATGMKKQGKIIASDNSNITAASPSKSDQYKLQEKLDGYEDKIRELKTKRRGNMVTAISGINESIGATVGGVAGASFGVAMGEGKEIIQAGLTGMGIGDKAGSIITKPLGVPGAVSDVSRDIKEWRNANKEYEKEVSSFNSSAKEAIKTRENQISSIKRNKKKLNEDLKQIDAGNMDM